MKEMVRTPAKMAETKGEKRSFQTQKRDFSQPASSPVSRILFLQRTIGNHAIQRLIKSGALQAKAKPPQNNTGMPDKLKAGIEQLSGMNLSGVRVHYNSSGPDQLNALAYTQGQDIHIAPGQEKHLPHEGWHAVQQMQGRVKPTIQAKGVAINDDQALEKEADTMGAMALGELQAAGMDVNQHSYISKPVSILQLVTQLNGIPTISHETKLSAPDGSAKTRTDAGVGEKVTFKGSATGNWTSTGGTPDKLDNSNEFAWTAPNRAATVNIKLAVADKSASVSMNVIEPDSITATKNSEIAYPNGTQGAGMKLTFNYHPKKVSFGNVQAKEVSGPASDIVGYYQNHGMPHYHNSGDTFTSIGEDNKDTAPDTAAQSGYPKPWSDGSFKWIIPNNFRVKTEGGDGKKFTDVTQVFTIDGTGKTKITKAGAEVERSP
jgi:hypothetical protein